MIFSSLSPVLKNYGQQLKAPAAMVRLRLYETLLLLPPQTFEGNIMVHSEYEYNYKANMSIN